MSESGTATLLPPGDDMLLPERASPDEQPDFTYPHERGETTPQTLTADVAAQPEAYHPAIRQHVDRLFGPPAVQESKREDEPYTAEQIQAAEYWLAGNGVYGGFDADDKRYYAKIFFEGSDDPDSYEGIVRGHHDEEKYRQELEQIERIEATVGKPAPLPLDKKLALSIDPMVLLERIDSFTGIDKEVIESAIERGDMDEVDMFLEQYQHVFDIRTDADFAKKILTKHGKYAAEFIARCIQSEDDEDDTRYPIFTGLNSGAAFELARNGKTSVVQDYADKFEGLEFDSDLATAIIEHGGKLKWRLYKKLDDRVAQACLSPHGSGSSQDVIENLFRFEGLSQETLGKLSEFAGRPIQEFPHGENRRPQYEWYADMTYVDLHGWPKTKLGQLIALRIEQGLEHNLHDATEWLSEFVMRNEDLGNVDVATVQALLASGETNPQAILDRAKVEMIDTNGENMLLRSIIYAPADLRARLNLPGKELKIRQMFFQPANQLVYQTLLQVYREPDFSMDKLRDAVLKAEGDFYNAWQQGNHKDLNQRLGPYEFRDLVIGVVADLFQDDGRELQPASKLVQRLQAVGEHRQAYIDDAMSWLLRHGTSPSNRLVKVWKDRPLALANGVHDSARTINFWQNNNALMATLDEYERTEVITEEFKREILSERWQSWRDTLLEDLSAANTIRAIEIAKQKLELLGDEAKVLPADKIEMELGEAGSGQKYRFDVLDKKDPRGFVIGEQTGCCMTIGGASSSCIFAGYEYPNAGFAALYGDDDGRIRAQSFWYVHPDHPETLVLDNIEANEGRDYSKIISAYQAGLKQYIEKQRSVNPDFKITKVHVGEGFTEVKIDDLPEADSIPPLNEYVYTDAERQRLLLDMNA